LIEHIGFWILFFPGYEERDIGDSLEEMSNQGVGECDVLINALSREAFPDRFALLDRVDCSGIKGFFDLSYRPDGLPTSFLKVGLSLKRPVEDGLRMLLEQGALSFEIWTGQSAPRDVMAEALRKNWEGAFPLEVKCPKWSRTGKSLPVSKGPVHREPDRIPQGRPFPLQPRQT